VIPAVRRPLNSYNRCLPRQDGGFGARIAAPDGEFTPMSIVANVLNLLVILTGLFLIGLVLIQRGKGGGLAGAFGGVGGSSPFGSKAGDAFTRITIYVAAFWIVLLMVQVKVTNGAAETSGGNLPGVSKPG